MHLTTHPPLFIHVPRTGGTSVRRALDLHYPYHSGHRRYNKHEDGPRFIVGMARNPFDRAISLYHLHSRGLTFHQWVDQLGPNVPSEQPIWHWMQDAHLVLRFEHFLLSVSMLADIFEIDPMGVPHTHISDRLQFHQYYTSQYLIDKVAEFYRMDLKKFGYVYPDPRLPGV